MKSCLPQCVEKYNVSHEFFFQDLKVQSRNSGGKNLTTQILSEFNFLKFQSFMKKIEIVFEHTVFVDEG